MKEYHKIQTVFKRDPFTNFKTLIVDEYSTPELEYLSDNIWIWHEQEMRKEREMARVEKGTNS